MPDEDGGVTLGEVNRNVTSLRTDIREITKDVVELKVSGGTQKEKVDRLERIVYGALGVALAGLITAVLSIVLRH